MRTHTSAKLPAVAGVGCVGNTSHRAALRPCVQHRIPSHRQNLSLSYPLPCRTMSTSAASTAAAPSAQAAARSDLQQGSASMQVAIQELQQLCQDALKTLGYDDQQALTISEVLLYAQLRNNSNNMVKVVTGGLDKLSDEQAPETQLQTDISAIVNGNHSAGIVVMKQALQLALEKATQSGCGIVGTNHTATGSGAIGYWAKQLADKGMIGIVLSQSPEYVTPHGATEAIFGTNPFAIGVPSESGSVVVDMATSAASWFGLVECDRAGQQVAADVGYDAAGHPTTDPAAIYKGGSIRVFDRSYKGSNIALMIELLAGPLVGGAVEDKLGSKNWGNLMIALHPRIMGDRKKILRDVHLMLARVKGARKAEGVQEIMLPGERGNRLAEQRLTAGKIDIPKSLYQGLKDMVAAGASASAPQPTSTLPHPPITSITPEAASISSTSPTVTSTTPDVTGSSPQPNSISSPSPGLSSTSTVTSTTQGAPSSSTGIPIITSIAPEATQGSDADGGMLGGSASEQESSGRSAEAAASSSGAMPADITGQQQQQFEEDVQGQQHQEQQALQAQQPLPGRRHLSTKLLHPPQSTDDPYEAVSPPLYQTATFGQPSATTNGPYDYTRSGNPTRTQLETQMADLEGADQAFAFASGMAALAAVLRLVGAGKGVVAGDDLYGGTSRLLAQVAPNLGIQVTNVDTTDIRAVEKALVAGHTKLVMLESPTNPRMQICDIATLTQMAHQVGALVVVDNSIMAPTFQQPLALGADISMTSATKFLNGHSDIMGGILSVKGADLAKKVYFTQNAEGAILSPFDCWLCLRGLKTMALRMEAQARNCAILAQALSHHPLITKINYPGLPGSRGHDLNASQATSGGSLFSFETGNVKASQIIAEQTKLFKITVSFGSVSSSISLPCYMSHASIPAEVRAARGLPDHLVRISVGMEHPQDLLDDLDQAMHQAMLAIGQEPVSLTQFAQPQHSEAQLLQKIATLERQLAAKS
ncbi:TPA: hypothetical protein ACH3X2_003352 [Trebouxia sp. C0005]